MKKVKMIALMMIVALMFTACGGKQADEEKITIEDAKSIDELLQGTWYMTEVDGNNNSIETSAKFQEGKVEIYQITETNENLVSSGTYEIAKDKILLYYDGSDTPTELSYTYEHGALTLNDGKLLRR